VSPKCPWGKCLPMAMCSLTKAWMDISDFPFILSTENMRECAKNAAGEGLGTARLLPLKEQDGGDAR
jgi:hypothetical protein